MKTKEGDLQGFICHIKSFAETFKKGSHNISKLLPNWGPMLGEEAKGQTVRGAGEDGSSLCCDGRGLPSEETKGRAWRLALRLAVFRASALQFCWESPGMPEHEKPVLKPLVPAYSCCKLEDRSGGRALRTAAGKDR